MKKLWIGSAAVIMAAVMTFPSLAGQWVQDTSKPANQTGISNWWYRNDNGTYPSNGWFWLDGNSDGFAECYRFNENGWMYSAASIDGYTVNDSGAWIQNNVIQYKNLKANTNRSSSAKEETTTASTDSSDTVISNDVSAADAGASSSELTDEQAYKKLIALKKSYPEGKTWTNSNTYQRGYVVGGGCIGFAFVAMDHVFGKGAPSTTYDTLDWDELRVGDHIRMYNDQGGEHSVIILKVNDDSVTVCEGNYNSSIHWGRKISRDTLESEFIYRETCYDHE